MDSMMCVRLLIVREKLFLMVRLQLLLIDNFTFVVPQRCMREWNESGGSWHSNSFCRNAFCCVLSCAVINIE